MLPAYGRGDDHVPPAVKECALVLDLQERMEAGEGVVLDAQGREGGARLAKRLQEACKM